MAHCKNTILIVFKYFYLQSYSSSWAVPARSILLRLFLQIGRGELYVFPQKIKNLFIYKQAFKQLARDTVSLVYSVLSDGLSATTAGDYLLGFQLGGALEWIGQEEEGHDCNALKSLELFNTDDEKQARFLTL